MPMRIIRSDTFQTASILTLIAFLFLQVIPLTLSSIPEWYGKYIGSKNPVVTRVQLLDVPTPRTCCGTEGSVFRGETEKLLNCEFVSMDWYLGTRSGAHVAIQSYFLDQPKINGRGMIRFTGIVVRASPMAVLTATYADVRHRCPGPFGLFTYPVVSAFYDPGLSTTLIDKFER